MEPFQNRRAKRAQFEDDLSADHVHALWFAWLGVTSSVSSGRFSACAEVIEKEM